MDTFHHWIEWFDLESTDKNVGEAVLVNVIIESQRKVTGGKRRYCIRFISTQDKVHFKIFD